jgi:hypothetical protein
LTFPITLKRAAVFVDVHTFNAAAKHMGYAALRAIEAVARLRAEIARLRAALEESYQDNLYSALHCGVTGDGGKWWPGGMSDAEWFCRQAEISQRPEFTLEELLARVPGIAQRMVDHA